jgi:putative ABC transport system substrate-binding protein
VSVRCTVLKLVTALVLGLFTAPAAVEAQPAGRLPRVVGYLTEGSIEDARSGLDAFRTALRELGYVEGEAIAIEPRYAEGQAKRLPGLAAELVRHKVDLLLVTGGAASEASKLANTIPLVLVAHPDPVGARLVASLARPGGNITGLSDAHGELIAKRLELLKAIAPSGSRVAFLFNPAGPGASGQLEAVRAAARALRVTLLVVEVNGPGADDVERAFGRMRNDRPGDLLVHGNQMLFHNRKRIGELAAKSRLPTVCSQKQWVDAGCLSSFGANHADLYRRAATYVDKILKGAKPADLPVEQPTKFELVINLKTAKALGLTIPPSVLARADHLIQ